jgi:hypothetical protein
MKFKGQNGYSTNAGIGGISYERDITPELVVGGQINSITGRMSGADTSGAALSGYHVGLYADYDKEGWTLQNDLGHASIKNQYARTIGPFSNAYKNKSDATWVSSRLFTPEMSGFRPFVGATVLKNNTPTVTESGSIQSAQTINGNTSTQTIGEYGLQYSTEVLGSKVTAEAARTSNGITEANLSLSKAKGDVTYAVTAGKLWLNSTTSDMVGLNVKIKF